MYKHYIRINEDNYIIKAFSDAFIKPLQNDICIYTGNNRHYHLQIYNEDGLYNYKYVNGQVIETTSDILEVESLKEELKLIFKWFENSDYILFKVIRGNWENTDPRYLSYLVEYQVKHERKEEIEAILGGV